MTWRAAVTLAGRGLRRRPGRAALTVLAVALAAALLTALLTISGTAETRVLDELADGGPLAGIKVAAATPDPAQIGRDDARPGDPRDLDDQALARIEDLPAVREVVPISAVKMLVVSPQVTGTGALTEPFVEDVVGFDPADADVLPLTLLSGRLPTPGAADEVVVTEGYLERFDDEGPAGTADALAAQAEATIGTEVQMGAARTTQDGERLIARGLWFRARIVGVVAQEIDGGQILAAPERVEEARRWAAGGIPDERFDQPSSPYVGLYVVADGLDAVGEVRAQIVAIGYSTSAPENLIASVRRYLRVVEIVLTSVGAIALAVAALGISNAMLAAVRERRREIGVLKAIGGRDRDVRRIFLVEAASLGLLGGVVGAAVGVGVARAIGGVVNGYLTEQGLAGVELTLPVGVVAATVVGSTVLAVVAGTLPAARASRLPARDAVGAL